MVSKKRIIFLPRCFTFIFFSPHTIQNKATAPKLCLVNFPIKDINLFPDHKTSYNVAGKMFPICLYDAVPLPANSFVQQGF